MSRIGLVNPLVTPQYRPDNGEISRTTLKNMFLLAFGVVLNTARVAAAVVMLILSKNEVEQVPLRLWLLVNALLCCLQIIIGLILRLGRPNSYHVVDNLTTAGNLVVTINSTVYYIWLLLGLYWVFSSGKMLADNAPMLYWLSVIFLAMDTLSVVIAIVISCCRRLSEIMDNTQSNDHSQQEMLLVLIETCNLVLNTASVVATVVVLLLSIKEDPQIELRSWIVFYGLLCLCGICVPFGNDRQSSNHDAPNACIRIKSGMTMGYIVLLLSGLYWVISGQMPAETAPKLCGLSVIFMVKELFYFVILAVVYGCLA